MGEVAAQAEKLSAVNEAVSQTRRDMAVLTRQTVDDAVAKVRYEMAGLAKVEKQRAIDEAVAVAVANVRREMTEAATVVEVGRPPPPPVPSSPLNVARERKMQNELVASLQAQVQATEELCALENRCVEQDEIMELQAIFLRKTERALQKELRDNETIRSQR